MILLLEKKKHRNALLFEFGFSEVKEIREGNYWNEYLKHQKGTFRRTA